jgi:hypothetical protein
MKNLERHELPKGAVDTQTAKVLALVLTLLAGCSETAMQKCLGEEQGETQSEEIARLLKDCNESVNDLATNDDPELQMRKRLDAERACIGASEKLIATEKMLRAQQEMFRARRKFGKRDQCGKAVKGVRGKARKLNRTQVARLQGLQ